MALALDPSSASNDHTYFTLSLLGPFQASRNDQTVGFATDAARALLAYLAVEAGRPHRREFLATLLWPEQSQSAAFTNLRQTIARVRRSLTRPVASTVMTVTRRTLEVHPDFIDLDCVHLERLITACEDHAHGDIARCRICIERLEQACALYRGAFLEGVFSGSSHVFDEWVISRREHFQRRVLEALRTLAHHCELVSDYEAMGRWAARQLTLEPWREEAHRQLMRALVFQDQRTSALAQYETCRRILALELGIEPDHGTRALYERIRDAELAPELLRAPAPVHNLPAQLTPFVGREREIEAINAHLGNPDVRLLTLVGAGGMGKTRLAIEVASQCLNRFPDGVFFVSLAPLVRIDAISTAIATAMRLDLTGEIRQTLPLVLRDKQALLVLDNFEHLLEGVGTVVELLEAAPGLQVIATSRERLNVHGEHVYTVSGMDYSVPDNQGAAPAAAIRLFAQSVRRVQTGFVLQGNDLAAATRICQLVDGMPLGLELAAAWADMLSLDEIAEGIERSIDFLSSDWRDTPERHRSVRAVFDSSWRSLEASERQVFRRISVFQGGFTHEAAQAVAGASLLTLARLAHKSLLVRQEGRYQVHELLRQFGAAQLDLLPEEHTDVLERHSDYFLNFVARLQLALDGDEPHNAAVQIQADIDNIEKAWKSAIQLCRFENVEGSAIGLWRYSSLAGSGVGFEQLMRMAVERLQSLLERGEMVRTEDTGNSERLLSKLHAMQAAALVFQGEFDAAIPIAERAITLGRTSQGIEGEVFGYLIKGQALAQMTRYGESRSCLEEARNQALEAFSKGITIKSLHLIEYLVYLWLGAIAVRQNEYVRAENLFRLSLDICRRRGDLRGEVHNLANLANAARSTHEYSSAREHYERALHLARKLGYRLGEATNQQGLGEVARLQGDPSFAREMTGESLIVFREIGDRMREAVSLAYLGRLHLYLGDEAGSREHLDQFVEVIEGIDAPFAESWGSAAFALLHYHAGDLEQAISYSRRAVTAAESVGNDVDHADALVITGQILARMNCLAEAASIFHRAISLCDNFERASEVISARAGLALVALSERNIGAALVHVNRILKAKSQYPEHGGDQPFDVCLTCYRVLDAAGDPRAADVLQDANLRLIDYAKKIADDSLRHSYLDNVTAHRELRQAWAAHTESTTPGPHTEDSQSTEPTPAG